MFEKPVFACAVVLAAPVAFLLGGAQVATFVLALALVVVMTLAIQDTIKVRRQQDEIFWYATCLISSAGRAHQMAGCDIERDEKLKCLILFWQRGLGFSTELLESIPLPLIERMCQLTAPHDDAFSSVDPCLHDMLYERLTELTASSDVVSASPTV